jgi:multiple antibiotic resistance protein
MDYLSFLLTSFTTLFVIIDPPGNIPIFLALTEKLTPELKERISKKSTITAASLLLIVALTGGFILDFFRISIDGLRIAGGILLFAISVDILIGGARREAYINKEIKSESLAVFPIALPLYTGPGAITAAIVLSSEASDTIMRGIVILSIVVVYGIVRLTHIYSNQIIRILGKSGSDIIARLMAIFLAAIAVEFVFEGVKGKILEIVEIAKR